MYKKRIKRLLDLSLAVILLLLLLPLLVVLTIVISIETGRNPFYSQYRSLSLGNKKFRILKFRTLHPVNSVKTEPDILHKSTLRKYVTLSGLYLRKTGLDELPQLINVIRGQMSLVGPRPLSQSDLECMKLNNPEEHNKRAQLDVKSGITGYWQVYGERDNGLKNLIDCDTYYNENISFYLDLRIIFSTIPVLIFAKHSDAIIGKKDKKSAFKGDFSSFGLQNEIVE